MKERVKDEAGRIRRARRRGEALQRTRFSAMCECDQGQAVKRDARVVRDYHPGDIKRILQEHHSIAKEPAAFAFADRPDKP